MNNELVKETKSICANMYNALKEKYSELEKNGAAVKILNGIADDMSVIVAIYNGVKAENAVEFNKKALEVQDIINRKYFFDKDLVLDTEDLDDDIDDDIYDDIDDEEDLGDDLDIENHENDDQDETTVGEDEKTSSRVVRGAAAVGLIALILVGLAHCKKSESKKRASSNDTDCETIEETDEPVRIAIETMGIEYPTETEDKNSTLVLGEYGTFFDVTDEEQINARAQYIIDNYYAPLMNELSEQERSIITRDNIANVIRVMAGELPLDENGNKVMDANIVDNYGQMFTVLIGNLGSSPQLNGRYYNVPAYMFTVDGSELSEFVKGYDMSFQKITDGFNKAADERLNGNEVTGGTMVREGIAELGTKYWNEWVMQGIYGDVNPFNFEAKDRLFAYLSSFAKYGQYAFEYNLDSMQAVCIPVCINYETKEKNEIPVNEIYVGYTSGEWNNVIAKAAGIPVSNEPDSIAFTQDLYDQLNWQYNNMPTQLKLK